MLSPDATPTTTATTATTPATTAVASPAPVDRPEELANLLTHGVGVLLAVAGTVLAVVAAVATRSPIAIVSAALYGGALILVYGASTGFHEAKFFNRPAPLRERWRLLDHAAIYVLIAATYTPVMLVSVGGAWGWSIVAIVWSLAVVGVGMKVVLVGRYDHFERIDTMLYLAMGWLSLVAVVPLWMNLSGAAFAWLVAGGIFYSGGCVFFLWDKLRFNHAIWHLFVLAGSACHWMTIVANVLPDAAA